MLIVISVLARFDLSKGALPSAPFFSRNRSFYCKIYNYLVKPLKNNATFRYLKSVT